MKKYVLFFISIGLLLGIFLIYNTISLEQSKKVAFSESGYILNNSTDRYYFYQDETYSTSYNDKIVFYDTEGEKVILNNDNFIHYSSGNIVGLQDSVLLDLSKIDENPIIYYNISANKEVKRISNRYSVKNLDSDLQFIQAIWKISANKYIVLGNNIKIVLNDGTEQNIEGYIEIQYSDNEIVSIYNQEISYQTISSDSYIELDDKIKVNLGTKIVSKDDENKMSLEDMVINSDDNVTLVDLVAENETEEENIADENATNTQTSSTSNSSSSTSTTTSSSSTQTQTDITNQGTTDVEGNTIENNSNTTEDENKVEEENTIKIDTPEIKYEESNENETQVDSSKVLNEPKFKLDDVEVTAVGIDGTIKITDDDDLLSKDESVIIKIINNETGKTIYSAEEQYGILSIPLHVQTLLPDTSYTIIASGTYIVNDTSYSKNFLYKTFVTPKIGIELEKGGFTDTSLSFNVNFSDELFKSATISILDENGEEIKNRAQTIENNNNQTQKISFELLDPDTKYQIEISKVKYDNSIQSGDGWTLNYDGFKTLKEKPTINTLNYSIDKKNGKFTLYIEDVTDNDESIQNYTYVMYRYRKIVDEEGKETLEYDTENIVYQRTTTNKEITVTVGNDANDSIIRDEYYGFRVIANTYDNEKYVEFGSDICGPFVLSGKTFPTVKFDKKEVTVTTIDGTLKIVDNESAITIDENNPLTIIYKNDMGDEVTYKKITDMKLVEIDEDADGNSVISIPIDISGLKAETTYVFSAYGSIDLEDGNGIYNNVFIGSSMVTTNSYKELKAEFKDYENMSQNEFTVGFNLDGEEFEEESLDSITFVMQAGSDFNPNNNYWSIEINSDNFRDWEENVEDNSKPVESLQDLFCNNTVLITPEMIGGYNNRYNDINYILLATITVDGTKYKNKIPINCEETENIEADSGKITNTGSTEYTRGEETYTAAYALIKTKGTVPGITDANRIVNVFPILNEESNVYGIENNKDLNSDTVVGYRVQGGFRATDGTRMPSYITYYVWDRNGNPITVDGKQLIYKAYFDKASGKTPAVTFEVGQGTSSTLEEDNKNGLFRGGAYYFTYTVTYENDDGTEDVWPTIADSSMDHTSIQSQTVKPPKQEPIFVMYPKTSDDSSITYIYSCYDYDKALDYVDGSTSTSYIDLEAGGTIQKTYRIETNVSNKEVVFNDLGENITYIAKYRRKLDKTNNAYTYAELVTQKFEGIKTLPDISFTAEYDYEKNPNKIIIDLEGDRNDLLQVAGAKVTIEVDGSAYTTDLLNLNVNDDNFTVEVDITTINIPNIIGKEATVKVNLYYANGTIGFIPDKDKTHIEYAVYVSSNNKYMIINETDGTWTEGDYNINGKTFNFEDLDTVTSNEFAYMTLTDINGKKRRVEFQYTKQGLKYGDLIIVQKGIASKELSTTDTVTIDRGVAGIKLDEEKIETQITEATINAELINPLNLDIENIYVEIFYSKNKDEEADWENAETRSIGKPSSNQFDFTLDSLMPAYYYKIRFKYKLAGSDKEDDYTYMYDYYTQAIKHEYQFETLATIGATNVTIDYESNKYTDKYLNINYNVDSERSYMYEKTRYEFYKLVNGKYEKVNLNENNIYQNIESGNGYEVINGSLYVTNSIYGQNDKSFDSVSEKINIKPEFNSFEFGKEYKLVMTPILNTSLGLIEIEKIETKFTLKSLSEQKISIRMIRVDDTTGMSITEPHIKTTIQIDDKDCVIAGSDYGEYTLKAYAYENKDAAEEDKKKNPVQLFDVEGNEIADEKIFNLKDNSINYSVYIKNPDYRLYYEIVMEFNEDKGSNNNLENKVETRVLQAIDNDAGVIIGTTGVTSSDEGEVTVEFYDSYKITDINRVDYTIYNNTNGLKQTGMFDPTPVDGEEKPTDWIRHPESEMSVYYTFNLPDNLTDNGTYVITLNLYKDDMFAGTREIAYTYRKSN